jgi:hypothetical protein
MTFHLFRRNRPEILALLAALGSADSLITLGASAITFGCEKEARTCTLRGCAWPPVTLHIQAAPALPTGDTLTATLCRGNACVSGPFTLGGADAAVSGITNFTIPANPAQSNSPRASFTLGRYPGITIEYTPSSPYDLADGDDYTITIENTAGDELLSRETTVTYTKSYPNGPDCDPNPCLQADVTL